MKKAEFLSALEKGLSALPQEEREERLSFYGEIIDDRIEEGLGEEEAVSEIGSVEDVVSRTLDEVPLGKLVKEKIKPGRRLPAWAIVLIITAVLFFSIYISVWAVIISLWAANFSIFAASVCSVAAAAVSVIKNDLFSGALLLSAAFILAGLGILMFFCCKAASTGTIAFTKLIIRKLKSAFVRKEQAA